jgi:uncharacterized protein YqcC (DUF446 family)
MSEKRRRRGRKNAASPDKLAAIAAQLDAVEAEMKAIGQWSEGSPPEGLGSYGDTPFEAWLQWVFLPNARERTASNDLPKDSQVGLMALRTYDYFDHVPEAQRLVRLLNDFDDLVKR